MKLKEKIKILKRMTKITQSCMKCSLYSSHDEHLCRDCDLYIESKEIYKKIKGDDYNALETN